MSGYFEGATHTDPTVVVDEPASSPLADPPPGSFVGRYLIVDAAGRGAMGTVVRAYDPKLQREVALKFVTSRADADTAGRVVGEARAMARLNHPNVVAVHDVEELPQTPEHPLRIFIVMEFVEGATLSAWLRARDRGWRDVLEVFLQAGEGLAAAHAAALIHRDFKPSNVLIGADRRVRVTDFGLVRRKPRELSSSGESMAGSSDDGELTRRGIVMGTPAYMALEQHEGGDLDARADIYAFCVSLYEGLHRRKPFVAERVSDLAVEKRRGPPTLHPGDGVPVWLDRIVARGLAPSPSQRWSSMPELLAQLRRDPWKRRRRWLAGVTVAGLAGGSYIHASVHEARHVDACDARAAAMENVWGVAERQRVIAKFAADGRPFARDLGERVVSRIDDYTGAWSAARRSSCLAETSRSEATVGTESACLDEKLAAVSALTDTLKRISGDATVGALEAVLRLPDIDACADPTVLAARSPELTRDPAHQTRVSEIRSALQRAAMLEATLQYEDARGIVDAAIAEAHTLEDGPLLAEGLYRRGRIYQGQADYPAAVEDLREAYWSAGTLRRDRLAAEAAMALISIEGLNLGHGDQGKDWVRHAQMAIDRSGSRVELLHAGLARHQAALSRIFSDANVALAQDQRSLEIYQQELGSEHPAVASAIAAIAGDLQALGRTDEAERELERALALRRSAFGASHPGAAEMLMSLAENAIRRSDVDLAAQRIDAVFEILTAAYGSRHPTIAKARALRGAVESMRGHPENALEQFTGALEIYVETMGPASPIVAGAHNNVAIAYKNLGRLEEARDHYLKVLAIDEALGVVGGPGSAPALSNLARLHARSGEHEQAIVFARRAQEVVERHYGERHPDFANACVTEGFSLRALGQVDASIARYERSLEILRELGTEDSEATAHTLTGLGDGYILRGDHGRAREVLEEARQALASREAYDPTRAQADFSLARALWPERRDRARAIALARRAHEGLLAAGQNDDVEEIASWLERHQSSIR